MRIFRFALIAAATAAFSAPSLAMGSSGFLLKDAPAEQLVDAVRVIAAGEAMLAPSVTPEMRLAVSPIAPAQAIRIGRTIDRPKLKFRRSNMLTLHSFAHSNSASSLR